MGSQPSVDPQAFSRGPAKLSREERRAQLLNAAQEVFAARGYHEAGMDEIARAASVSKPVLYRHFPSKRELYMELLDSNLGTLTHLLLEALNSEKDNEERVQAAIHAFYRFIHSDNRAHRLVFEFGLINDPGVNSRLEAFNKAFAGAIAVTITEDTKLPPVEAELLGRGLAGLAQVSARYWLETNQNLDLNTASKLICGLAWHGISRFSKET
ncbi:TetR/AcrR family transcriptional regulator [Pseudarthrobacter oxydans]|uniref:TetR/AcrR family transcriptional regulator n=1 Tax=Pseudarthrobacter oxydans TaxID=1671 RepID=UPI0038306CDC